MPADTTTARPIRLRLARLVRLLGEDCQLWDGDGLHRARFAPQFPTPYAERVSPGHLLAVATAPNGDEVVIWRWYDAVVLSAALDGSVQLWEPGHGEVSARVRDGYRDNGPGSRVYASAGLAGAQWWAAGPITDRPDQAEVELAAVEAMYAEHGLWTAVFDG